MRIPTAKHSEVPVVIVVHDKHVLKFCRARRVDMYTLIERISRAGLRALLSLYPFVPFRNIFYIIKKLE